LALAGTGGRSASYAVVANETASTSARAQSPFCLNAAAAPMARDCIDPAWNFLFSTTFGRGRPGVPGHH
jgi:hypothetical protein